MQRIDLYRTIHKGQRARLFSLATEIGMVPMHQRDLVQELVTRCFAMVDELNKHSANEDAVIDPVLRERAPDTAAEVSAQHGELDAHLERLRTTAKAALDAVEPEMGEAQQKWYLACNTLISVYLAHLQTEETAAMPALWRYCSNQEIAALISTLIASKPPIERLEALRNQLPALNPNERSQLVGAALASLAPEMREVTFTEITTGLTQDQLSRLRLDLQLD